MTDRIDLLTITATDLLAAVRDLNFAMHDADLGLRRVGDTYFIFDLRDKGEANGGGAEQQLQVGCTTPERLLAHARGFLMNRRGDVRPGGGAHHDAEDHRFDGAADKRGRGIGARIRRLAVQVRIGDAQHRWDPERRQYLAPGAWYAWMGEATREGKQFGALQPWHYCATYAEREAAIAAYLKGARARALKTAAGDKPRRGEARAAAALAQRQADRIDGFDRDDLGASPDC
jgi:hypothetical protein